MVGYADPCPHCGNNKRRRFSFGSRSDDGTLLHVPLLPLPPTLRPRSKSDPTPLPAPPAAEFVVPRADAQKPASPPASTANGCADAAAPAPGGAALCLRKTPLSGRPGVTSVPPPESSEDSNPMTAAVPGAHPVNVVPAAATARTSSTSQACGSRRRLGLDADGSGEKERVSSKKKAEREAPCAPAAKREAPSEEDDMEEAAIRIRCNCGRVQEFVHRQKRTTT